MKFAAAEMCNQMQLISASHWDFAMVFLSAWHHEMSAIADALDFPQLWVPHKVSKYELREAGNMILAVHHIGNKWVPKCGIY